MEEEALREACKNALRAYPNDVSRYRTGKTGLMGLFTGHVMKETKGAADPKSTIAVLTELLNSDYICLGNSCAWKKIFWKKFAYVKSMCLLCPHISKNIQHNNTWRQEPLYQSVPWRHGRLNAQPGTIAVRGILLWMLTKGKNNNR